MNKIDVSVHVLAFMVALAISITAEQVAICTPHIPRAVKIEET
jgi:hypothetical protein